MSDDTIGAWPFSAAHIRAVQPFLFWEVRIRAVLEQEIYSLVSAIVGCSYEGCRMLLTVGIDIDPRNQCLHAFYVIIAS